MIAHTSEFARIGRFGLVGVFNTGLDFALFNILSGRKIGLTKLWANTTSTSVAMIISYFLNRAAVFRVGGGGFGQVLSFFVVTAVGLYVIQNGIIYFLAQRWKWPSRLLARLAKRFAFAERHSDMLLKNGAKVVGTLASLIWNYILYKKVVFHT